MLTGDTSRFSSTHRVAVVARDTFQYIKGRCEVALALLPVLKAAGVEGVEGAAGAHRRKGKGSRAATGEPLARTIQRLGEVHREVEFQWIRMFWLQGTRHAASHGGYWKPRVEELTQAWDAMELGYRWALAALRTGAQTLNPKP